MNGMEIKLTAPSTQWSQKMQVKLDHLAKPVKSLGRLEELADHLAAIYRTTDLNLAKRTCLVFAADNGVVKEGVSASPEKITAIQAVNMMNGHTVVAALAREYHCRVRVFDVGINTAKPLAGVVDRKIRRGTRDMLNEAAMTVKEAQQCIAIGMDAAQGAINEGAQIITTGELGMGNTTAASAMIAALLNCSPVQVVGRGSNISDQRLRHKVEVVENSLKRAELLENSMIDPFRVLKEVGAYELGAMAGAMIGTARAQKAIILDGFLSYAALLLAERLVPGVVNYVIPSHRSKEPGSQLVLGALGIKPFIDINMCVGEGAGAMLMFPWLDGVSSILENMNTLQEMNFNFVP